MTNHLNVVQRDISNMSMYIQACGTITTLISAPIIGAWSDYRGRRRPLILTLAALCAYTVLQTTSIILYKHLNVYYFLFVAETLGGCFGGVAMACIVASAIVIDDSRSLLERSGIPWRITLMCFCSSFGKITGALVYRFCTIGLNDLHEHHVDGFIRAYLVGCACCILSLVYAIFFIRETNLPTDDCCGRGIIQESKAYIFGCVRVLTEKRIASYRLCLYLLIVIMFVDFVNMDNSLQVLYFKQPVFGWSDNLFNEYLILKQVLTTIGVFALPSALYIINYFGKESVLLMLAILANCADYLIIGITESTAIIFLASTLYLIGSSTVPAYNTLLSKIIKQEETGRLFAGLSILLSLSPLFSKAVLYRIYAFSLDRNPGLVFIIISVLLFITLLCQGTVHCLMKPHCNEINKETRQNKIEMKPINEQL